MLGLLALLLPVAARADLIFLNRFGTVTITAAESYPKDPSL